MRAALRAIRMRQPKKLVLAVPVAATDTLEELATEVDDLVCLESYESFRAIGLDYDDFRQINDLQVILTLAGFPGPADAGKRGSLKVGAD
jgi:putative phosphoribosyl transferase